MRFRTPAMQMAYDSSDAAAFSAAALAYCAPSVTRVGASTKRINVQPGVQIQVELPTQFEEMDGGDGLRDGSPGSRILVQARTMTWAWSSLVMTKPSSAYAILDAALHPRQDGDGVYKTPDGYVVRAGGANSLPFELEEYGDLKYQDRGQFLEWLQGLDFEPLPTLSR